jgi:hypothetical protein
MVSRERHLRALERLLAQESVVSILGARQVGKTTLARALVDRRRGPSTIFDLEDPEDLARLGDPMLALRELEGLVVLDEVQRRPDLFPVLRVLVDRPRGRVRFLILGSASPALLRDSSESLAGRIAHYDLGGFALDEVGVGAAARLWLRGGFPRSYLARTDEDSGRRRRDLIRTFLERDLPQLGVGVPSATLRRFWTMLAHWHGQVWNSAEFARSFGVADHTVRRYLDVLTSAFAVRQLAPWHENLSKRQVKSPKVYLADSGILHSLLGVGTKDDLDAHPKVGASWEGFALDAVAGRLGARPEECHFWATHSGAELDLMVVRGRRRLGFEFKRTVAPSLTRSMAVAVEDLKLERLDVVHAGDDTFPLAERVRAVALRRLLEDLQPLPG